MLPVCEAETLVVPVVSVPEPSAACTVITGDEAIEVTTPAAVEASCTCHVCAPDVAVAVAVLPEPYVITSVCAAVRVTPVTVIVWPETESEPTLAVEKPGPATVDGGVQPDGTTTVTEPVSIPPVAGV